MSPMNIRAFVMAPQEVNRPREKPIVTVRIQMMTPLNALIDFARGRMLRVPQWNRIQIWLNKPEGTAPKRRGGMDCGTNAPDVIEISPGGIGAMDRF